MILTFRGLKSPNKTRAGMHFMGSAQNLEKTQIFVIFEVGH